MQEIYTVYYKNSRTTFSYESHPLQIMLNYASKILSVTVVFCHIEQSNVIIYIYIFFNTVYLSMQYLRRTQTRIPIDFPLYELGTAHCVSLPDGGSKESELTRVVWTGCRTGVWGLRYRETNLKNTIWCEECDFQIFDSNRIYWLTQRRNQKVKRKTDLYARVL